MSGVIVEEKCYNCNISLFSIQVDVSSLGGETLKNNHVVSPYTYLSGGWGDIETHTGNNRLNTWTIAVCCC